MKSIQLNTRQTILKYWGFFLATSVCIAGTFFIFKNTISAILLSMGVLLFYFGSIFFWLNFIPMLSNSHQGLFNIILSMFQKHLFNHGAFYKIEDGYFDKDYFSLRNKPAIAAMLIDDHSAVVLRNKLNEKYVLYSGLHQAKNDAEAIHSFDLRPTQFMWGPKSNRNPFRKSRNDRVNFKHANADSIACEQTKCTSANGVTLAPVFSIYYTIKPFRSEKQRTLLIQDVSTMLESNEIYGPLSSFISDSIGKLVSMQFKRMVQEMDIAKATQMHVLSNEMLPFITDRFENFWATEVHQLQVKNPVEAKLLSLINLRIFLEKVWVE